MPSGKLEFALLREVDDAVQQAVIAACTPRRFARRELVFHEGDPGDCLHLVVSGRFAVRVTTPRGDGVTLRVIGAPSRCAAAGSSCAIPRRWAGRQA